MKLVCKCEKLREAVQNTSRLVGKRLALEVLSLILLEADNSKLVIRATNLDIGVEVNFSAKVESKGSVAVPGATLSGFLAGVSSEDNIEMELVSGNLSISTKNANTVIKAHAVEEFPTLPVVEDGVSVSEFSITPDLLTSALSRVSFAASLSDVKPEIASVYFSLGKDTLTLVATDIFRLAEQKVVVKTTKESDDIKSVILPIKNALEISRLFEGSSDDVVVTAAPGQLVLKTNSIYVTSRLVEGTYPAYGNIVPKEYTTEAVFLKGDIQNALKVTGIFFDKSNQVVFRVVPDEDLFELSSRRDEIGESVVRLTGTLEGEAFDMKINARYLSDCLSAIKTDSVSMSFNGGSSMMRVTGISDPNFMYLLMPLNK